jgi:hypothetical protein
MASYTPGSTTCLRNVHHDNRVGLDGCALGENEKQNTRIDQYNLYNPISDCKSRDFEKVAECNNFVVGNGYGFTDECHVDVDSRLRNGQDYTQKRVLNQKYRKCASGGGDEEYDCDDSVKSLEDRMRKGNDFGLKRCDVVSEVSTLDLQFTPLIPCLSRNIQNPVHIVPIWTNGGESTRSALAQKAFLEENGFRFINGIADQSCGFTR